MVSIWQDATQAFGVAFPPLLQSLLFWVFASLVVHVCQRLVEHTAYSVDPSSRRISASHAALCIGCIVWALDVVGLFMYAELAHHVLELVPALSGLLIMAISARFTIPTLSTSASKRRIVSAGVWLAAGMLAAHFTVTRGHVHSFAQVNWLAIVLSMATAVGLATYTSVRHRSAKLSVLTPHFRQQSWQDKLLCGAAILLLHWLLVNTFPLQLGDPKGESDGIALMVIVLVFAIAVSMEQLSNMRWDAGRQQLLRRGLSMMRVSNMSQTAERDMELSLIADHLHTLLQPHRLALHFQPIVDFERRGVQFEALLRLTDKTLGNINPETFLLVCELQGKTAEVDRMILRNALDCVQAWKTAGLHDASISVNVAPVTLLDDHFAPWLRDELAQRALPARMLKLEMTEHAIIALGSQMVAAIHDLSAMGVAVLMDDFGAGYSSLGMLADLPIAGIKCDRLFVRQLAQDRRRQSLLRHVAALAQEFGLSVVVEGVETVEELQTLASVGLHSIQGYVFSRPMPAREVPQWHRTQMPAQRAALQATPHAPRTAQTSHAVHAPALPPVPWAPRA
ncbi:MULTISPECIES: EAL domain-containing protein [unclassified Acidovorax]|jgi:EAL domain-containing protein (putative c-di-GMP-specific phosphodiesterase class I)|uniref:EAL domain-containing protein n=1 Tax=unclassified Acidovorax TaxID=2684926 RepID=UPI000BC7356D|nr:MULTISPECIES: EAL domain-containing protein [unclassified Acidovorax]OZA58097.1 MAG: histidine kinase [Acidovorax sp. 17-64-282]HQS22643.1 EAL domain-containing protein [Acidovorax defluvii]OYY26213.1 MAG: histidine kinase [Acidovorax sp. 35-64-16]OYY85998.1 MAG: histidine kinase [Acidovorax sp. 28-64-14]OYZ44679.1 MAG: histidine kinase [Acidovorax sp. 16-64-162]